MKMFLILILLMSSLRVCAKDIKVFAASSLTDALTKIAEKFEKKTKNKIVFSFDSSSRLAHQIFEGANADIYISADEAWEKFLKEKNLININESVNFLSNQLVVATNVKNDFEFKDLHGLENKRIKRISLASQSVPAGYYSYQAISKSIELNDIEAKIIQGSNVRNVLHWIAEDEVDVGIVFKTDSLIEKNVKTIYEVPLNLHSPIVYTLSIIKGKSSPEVLSFYQYLKSQEALNIFKNEGFIILIKNGH